MSVYRGGHGSTFSCVQAWKLEAEDNLLYVMDGKLLDTYVEDEVLRVLHVALLCTQAVASTRPSMTRVVAMLLGDIDLPPITSGPGFIVSLMLSETPSNLTTSSFSTDSSGFRGKESAPLIRLSETSTKTNVETYPR